ACNNKRTAGRKQRSLVQTFGNPAQHSTPGNSSAAGQIPATHRKAKRKSGKPRHGTATLLHLRYQKGDRVFMFSREMLNSFAREGDAINELMEAFHLSSGVDIETACQAAGEMLLRNEEQPAGILVGIEG
ncbi:response regulator, partial [Aduncisulcus paluster]